MEDKMVYTPQEVANILNVSIWKTYDLIHQKIVPAIRIGRKFIIPRERFEEWLNNPQSALQ